MGKNGALLRQQKAQRATYTFTAAQLEEHDRQVRLMTIDRKREELKAYAHDVLQKDFAERQAMLQGPPEDVTVNVFSLLISVSCRVLVEEFHWTPIWKHSTNRNRLHRFACAVRDEIERIVNDERVDIRSYAEEVYDITGVKFEATEEEVDETVARGSD